MSNRVTIKQLEELAQYINKITGNPTSYGQRVEGVLHINVGHFHLEQAYGGVKLVQTVGPQGGIQDIIPGFLSKRELFEKMHCFIKGLDYKEHLDPKSNICGV